MVYVERAIYGNCFFNFYSLLDTAKVSTNRIRFVSLPIIQDSHFYLILADVEKKKWVVFDSKGDVAKWEETGTWKNFVTYFENLKCMYFF